MKRKIIPAILLAVLLACGVLSAGSFAEEYCRENGYRFEALPADAECFPLGNRQAAKAWVPERSRRAGPFTGMKRLR